MLQKKSSIAKCYKVNDNVGKFVAWLGNMMFHTLKPKL